MGAGYTNVRAGHIVIPHEFGSSRVNTPLAIVIALDGDIPCLMLGIFFGPAVARTCNGSCLARICVMQSFLVSLRIES